MSPLKASKFPDADSVISVSILTETHTREINEKPTSPNHKKVAEQSQENPYIHALPDFILSWSRAESFMLLPGSLFTPSL